MVYTYRMERGLVDLVNKADLYIEIKERLLEYIAYGYMQYERFNIYS